ncbi:RHS repeat-associated core domain-containing protein [Cysteiniphilum halobium]|uniref:RHS repeat-associated core domain-containing protein n=1 Tax=Cysteiniphilum halobium TaxID=2219059 RepID=UPI003F857FA2
MLNNNSKLYIGIVMSCLLITQSMAYSLASIKSVGKQSINHQRVLVSSAIHYNTNGNMSRDNKGARFSYNAANALTQVSLASEAKESDYYYANGLRAVAQSNTQVLVHYYSRNNELLNTSDGTQQSSAYLITNNMAVRSVMGDATVLLHNRHGSVIGQLSDKPKFYQYSVYGVQKTEDGGQKTDNGSGTLDLAINPLRYSGYMFDPLTGLYYLKSRDYDPSLRSFIQVDSYAFNNQGLINGYFYGNNNPLMGVDPSGHKFNWKEALGVAGTVLASALTGIGIGYGMGWSSRDVSDIVYQNWYEENLYEEKSFKKKPHEFLFCSEITDRVVDDLYGSENINKMTRTGHKKEMLARLRRTRDDFLSQYAYYPNQYTQRYYDQVKLLQVDIINIIAHDYPLSGRLDNYRRQAQTFAMQELKVELENLKETDNRMITLISSLLHKSINDMNRSLTDNAKNMLKLAAPDEKSLKPYR